MKKKREVLFVLAIYVLQGFLLKKFMGEFGAYEGIIGIGRRVPEEEYPIVRAMIILLPYIFQLLLFLDCQQICIREQIVVVVRRGSVSKVIGGIYKRMILTCSCFGFFHLAVNLVLFGTKAFSFGIIWNVFINIAIMVILGSMKLVLSFYISEGLADVGILIYMLISSVIGWYGSFWLSLICLPGLWTADYIWNYKDGTFVIKFGFLIWILLLQGIVYKFTQSKMKKMDYI